MPAYGRKLSIETLDPMPGYVERDKGLNPQLLNSLSERSSQRVADKLENGYLAHDKRLQEAAEIFTDYLTARESEQTDS